MHMDVAGTGHNPCVNLGAYFSVEKALFISGGGAFPTSNIISRGGLLRQHQSGIRPVWL